VLLAIERQSTAGSCSSLLIKLGTMKSALSGESQFQLPVHAQLLTDLEITAELVRSTLVRSTMDRNLDRKPVRSAEITFASKTAWAG